MSQPDKKLKPAGGKRLLFLSTGTYEKIRKLLQFADLMPDPSQFDVVEIAGRKQFRLRPTADFPAAPGTGGGGGTSAGSFFSLIVDAGHTYLQGGSISATEGGATLANFKVLHDGDLPAGISAGDILWADITCSGITDDDAAVLISGIEVTTAAYGDGADIPDSSFPGVTTAGALYIELGRWSATTFHPAGSGGFTIGGCGGNWLIERI